MRREDSPTEARSRGTGMITLGPEAKRSLEARHAYRRPEGECKFCDAHRADSMMPSHSPSENCESGKYPHCTCDVCF